MPAFERVAVVGLGRWGSSLHAALVSAGVSVEAVREIGTAQLDAELIWLCVSDAAIEKAAAQIVAKRSRLTGRVVVHSSGVHASHVLAAARKAGAKIGSIHPLMTFPTRKPVPLKGVPFAVEAAKSLAPKLESLVRLLGGKPFTVPAAGKAKYHAAAVMASPLLVALASAAHEAASLAGLSPADAGTLLEPMMLATIRNYFQRGPAASFSGPFARGDAETVSLHLQALGAHPSLQRIYQALAQYAVQTLPATNKRLLRETLAQNGTLNSGQ